MGDTLVVACFFFLLFFLYFKVRFFFVLIVSPLSQMEGELILSSKRGKEGLEFFNVKEGV